MRSTAALVAIALLVATAVYGSRPIVSYRALALGADTFELGLIVAAYASVSMLAALVIGRAVDRFGERPVIVAGAGSVVAASMAMTVAPSLVAIAATQALLGVGQLMVVIGSHTVLANRGSEAGRAHRIGLYMATASAGHAVGPAVAGMLVGDAVTTTGTTGVFVGAAACGLVATGLALALEPGRGAVEPPAPIGAALNALTRPGLAASLVSGVVVLTSVEMLVTYLPAYGTERNISPRTIGFALAVLGAAQMVPRIALGWLASRHSAFRLTVVSLTLSAAALAALALPLGGPTLITVMGAGGIGLGLGQPITFLWIAQRTPASVQGSLMSIRMAANRLAELGLPPTIGWVAASAGAVAIFWCSSALLAASLVAVVVTRPANETGGRGPEAGTAGGAVA
jgi:predicted MFS family arabinose efflux permease